MKNSAKWLCLTVIAFVFAASSASAQTFTMQYEVTIYESCEPGAWDCQSYDRFWVADQNSNFYLNGNGTVTLTGRRLQAYFISSYTEYDYGDPVDSCDGELDRASLNTSPGVWRTVTLRSCNGDATLRYRFL